MRIYRICDRFNSIHSVLHFGIGLIGSAIRSDILQKFTVLKEINIPVNWLEISSPKMTEELVSEITDYLSQNNSISEHTTVIWSAGRIGFTSSEEVTNNELKIFKSLFASLEQLVAQKYLNSSSKFILMSSAGGLFEGQVNINKTSKYNLKRPYTRVKFKMEETVVDSSYFQNYNILRISSAYSSKSVDFRMGLIATLVSNGIKNYTSTIYGNMNTIRDYIYDEDISDYVVRIIRENLKSKNVEFLVSGIPISIFQLKAMVEDIILKKIYIKFIDSNNGENISFLRSLQPQGLKTTDIKLNIKRLYLNIV